MIAKRTSVFFLTVLILSGCTFGPRFHRPLPPPVRSYTVQQVPEKTVSASTKQGSSQHFVLGAEIPQQWWSLFHSPELNRLIEIAIQANPDLRAANASLRATHEIMVAQKGAFYPQMIGNFNPTRQRVASELTSPLASNSYLFTLDTAQVTITYVADVFGLNRKKVEALQAETEVAGFAMEAVYLTITSNLVKSIIQEASLREQIKVTKESIAIARKQLALVRKSHNLGQIGILEVTAQEASLRQLETTLPPLANQLIQVRNAIANLCGQFPSGLVTDPFTLASLELPKQLPVSLPAQLVSKRPDVRAAEATMHAAGAQVGVAIASRLPNVSIGYNAGSAATAFSNLFSSATGFWIIGGNLLQPLFTGGTLLHQQRAAVALYHQTIEQYRGTVLTAFQDVANALTAIDKDAQALKAAAQATYTAKKSLDITMQQWQLGAVGYLSVLNAELTYQQAKITMAQYQANRLTDTVGLFQALGGSWLYGCGKLVCPHV